jgi:hypothetical protein
MTIIDRLAFVCIAAIAFASTAARAEEPNCGALRPRAKIECLEKGLASLQSRAQNGVEMGTRAFGQSEPDSPEWSLENLGGGRATVWTSPRLNFPRKFDGRPAVLVSVAGIDSGANVDTDRFGFSVEAADVDEAGFRVALRRALVQTAQARHICR